MSSMTTDIVTDADVEDLARCLGFLADDTNYSLTSSAAPESQQDGGRGEPSP